MVQKQLKLKLNKKQEQQLNEWLWILTGVWNWAIRKIELDAKNGVYYTKFDPPNNRDVNAAINTLIAGVGTTHEVDYVTA